MSRLRLLAPALAVLSLTGLSALASADSVSYTATVPTASTNFSTLVNLPGFDPSFGTLTAVQLVLTATVLGDASFESLDASPATVNVNLSTNATATAPGALTVTTIPLASTSVNVGAYDGVLDFGGISGRTFSDLTNTATNSSTTTTGLGSYIGVASVPITVGAVGASTASGPGNLASVFGTSAGAVVGVTYTYNAVPEPTVMAGLAVGSLALLRRRRQ